MRQDGRRIEVSGTVQGVGFRPWVYRVAQNCGVAGQVSNGAAGVTIDVFGETEQLDRFVHDLRCDPPAASRIENLVARPLPFVSLDEFTITPSVDHGLRRISIPPDLATCPDCLGETLDPLNRRFRYPFTNCTNCGPRYSIVRDVPYDRANTTMQPFKLCVACQTEYDSPADRRFHAEPNACPLCGPRLSAHSSNGSALTVPDPLRFAIRTINAQMIVALEGIGGFHLVCDATSETAVNRLRERKRRPSKPFAIMVKDLAAANELAYIGDAERALLTSLERPIVLLRSRYPLIRPSGTFSPASRGRRLSDEARSQGTEDAREPDHASSFSPPQRGESARRADEGFPEIIGLMLPYSPLHHLLLQGVDKPLVMTSGNRSDEPMVHDLDGALESLAGIADVFISHDRAIAARVDDSIARIIAGKPVLLRRSRGYVPRPIPLKRAVSRPILACGAQFKNTFCLVSDDRAFVGPHVGDLEDVETIHDYVKSIDRAKALLGWTPEVVAHDLHPDYASTRYALEQRGVTAIGVQHHHAHVASVMAEHHLEGAVLGVAWDGTGHGTDGAAWGGEFLLATAARFSRLMTFRPLLLAGGDLAVREIWRIGLAALIDVFGDVPDLPILPDRPADVVRRMLASRVNTPAAHGVGRWFDAFAALFLGRSESTYEGEAAMDWNNVADREERGRYPFVIDRSTEPWQIDPRPMVRAAVSDFTEGVPASVISGRFHNTLARMVADVADIHGDDRVPIVLSGGCFQSSLLTEKIIELLGSKRQVFFNEQVPPGDGGIALGQALVADAVMRERARTGGL